MPHVKIIKTKDLFVRQTLFNVTALKALIVSYMQYEDAMIICEWFNLPEPARPLALNITDLFNYLTPECFITSIYIPITYEGTLDLMDLYELDNNRVAYHKFIYLQCRHCFEYNKLNFTFVKMRDSIVLHFVAKKVYDPIAGIPGRTFLCDCQVRKRNGATTVTSITLSTGDDMTPINKILNGSLIPSPVRHS
jgi:hypothetical protein